MVHVDPLVGDVADRNEFDCDMAEIFYEIECDHLADTILADAEATELDDLVAKIELAAYEAETNALVDEIFAVPLRPRVRNATSKFLDKRIAETGGIRGSFMAALKAAVIKKLPVSNAVGMVDDHIQNCFLRLIQRDSLRDRLAAGHKITDQQIAMFAVRAGYTDIRDSGTDPVCRELFGARTEREREKGVVTQPITDPRVVWASSDSSEIPGTWVDIEDTLANQDDEVQFLQIWERLENAIRKHKPGVADRFIGVLRARSEGNTVADLANLEDVSGFRATSMMAEIRRVLRMEGMDTVAGLAGLLDPVVPSTF